MGIVGMGGVFMSEEMEVLDVISSAEASLSGPRVVTLEKLGLRSSQVWLN